MNRNPRDPIELHCAKMDHNMPSHSSRCNNPIERVKIVDRKVRGLTRIDGHGCNGCINIRESEAYHNQHYCRSFRIEGSNTLIGDINYNSVYYRIIDCELDKRPEWCELNQCD